VIERHTGQSPRLLSSLTRAINIYYDMVQIVQKKGLNINYNLQIQSIKDLSK